MNNNIIMSREKIKKLLRIHPEMSAVSITRKCWDEEADEYNKWEELGQDEKDELILMVIDEKQKASQA